MSLFLFSCMTQLSCLLVALGMCMVELVPIEDPALWVELDGPDPFSFSVYAHHLAADRSPALDRLSGMLPTAVRGDWHWFTSSVDHRTV